jgi:hypothetical protein
MKNELIKSNEQLLFYKNNYNEYLSMNDQYDKNMSLLDTKNIELQQNINEVNDQ